MQNKYPDDFRAKEWNWSDYINNSNGLLSQIVENTSSEKAILKFTKKPRIQLRILKNMLIIQIQK